METFSFIFGITIVATLLFTFVDYLSTVRAEVEIAYHAESMANKYARECGGIVFSENLDEEGRAFLYRTQGLQRTGSDTTVSRGECPFYGINQTPSGDGSNLILNITSADGCGTIIDGSQAPPGVVINVLSNSYSTPSGDEVNLGSPYLPDIDLRQININRTCTWQNDDQAGENEILKNIASQVERTTVKEINLFFNGDVGILIVEIEGCIEQQVPLFGLLNRDRCRTRRSFASLTQQNQGSIF